MARTFFDLKERLLLQLADIASKLESGKKLRVGFLEGATETRDGKVVSVPMVAAIQNFGAPKVGIPPRPFFTNFVKNCQGGWGSAVAKNLIAYDWNADQALRAVGEGMKAQLQQSITDTNSPQLSQVTLMLRKMRSEGGPNFVVTGATVGEAARRVAAGEDPGGVSRKPLIDTGQMQQAVDFEVV